MLAWFQSFLPTLNALAEIPIVKALGPLLGIFLVYWLGLRAYFKQKQAEHTRSRVLDQGLDRTAQQLDFAMGVHRHNWALLLRHLKLYRDAPIPISMEDFFVQFRELDQGQFNIAPIHRLSSLIGDEIVWTGYQKVFSFVATRNDQLKSDLGVALNELASKPSHPKKEEFIKNALVAAEKMSTESNALYPFMSELMNLANIVDSSKLSRRDIKNFARRRDVRELLLRLHEKYPDWKLRPHERLVETDSISPALTGSVRTPDSDEV